MADERRENPRFPCEVTVEASWRGGSRFYTTTNVSLEGAHIGGEPNLENNHVVKVRLYPPGTEAGIAFVARVRHVVTAEEAAESDREPGMGFQIFAIDDHNKALWVAFLTDHAQCTEEDLSAKLIDERQQPGSSARRFVRHTVRMEVLIRDMNAAFKLVSRDLSMGGIFLETNKRVPAGTRVELVLTHPITKKELSIDSKVARTAADGLGIEFMDLTDDMRRNLVRFALTGRAPDAPESF